MNEKRQFWLSTRAVTELESASVREHISGNLISPLGNQAGLAALSRRQFVKTAGFGVGALVGFDAFPRKARAIEPFTFGAFLFAFAVAVCAGIALDHLRAARWYRRQVGQEPPDDFHAGNAEHEYTDARIAPYQLESHRNCYFAIDRLPRFGPNRDLDSTKDLNWPEVARLKDQFTPGGHPYCPAADPAASRRRRLSRSDMDLFEATLRLYAATSRVPARNQIQPIYAREMSDERGRRFTGFAMSEPRGLNFLLGSTSSA